MGLLNTLAVVWGISIVITYSIFEYDRRKKTSDSIKVYYFSAAPTPGFAMQILHAVAIICAPVSALVAIDLARREIFK